MITLGMYIEMWTGKRKVPRREFRARNPFRQRWYVMRHMSGWSIVAPTCWPWRPLWTCFFSCLGPCKTERVALFLKDRLVDKLD